MTSELHNQAKTCADTFLKSEREMFKVLLDVDREKTFEQFQYTFLTPYCIKELNLSEDVAKCFVRVARKTLHVPELGEAVVSGDLSIYKARAVCSVIAPENFTEWIEKAKKLSKSKLEKEVAESRDIKTKKLSLELSFEALEDLERIRNFKTDKEYLKLEDAIEISACYYVERFDPVEKAKRADLSKDTFAAIHHEVNLRDLGRCQMIYADGSQCEETKWLHRHHIIHRKDGGPDTVDNLVTLCSAHHQMLHREHLPHLKGPGTFRMYRSAKSVFNRPKR